MKIVFKPDRNRYEAISHYLERDILQTAEFKWDPRTKRWWTDDLATAAKLIDFADFTARTRIKKQQAVEAVAALFATETRDANRIAEKLGCSKRTVYRIRDMPAFHARLDALGYTGERMFQRKKRKSRCEERTKKQQYQLAKALWFGEMSHLPEHSRTKAIAEHPEIHTKYNTIRRWTRDFKQKKS